MHYIHYIPCIIYDISSTLCDVTIIMCVTSHNDSICDIKHSMFMTYSFIWHHAQCYDHTTIVCLHRHYAWHYTQCILDITQNVPILWKEVNVCHHSIYLYDTICTTYDIISTLYENTPLYLMTSSPLCLTSHPVYLTSPQIDITQFLYLWNHTLYVYDISTIYGITHSVTTTHILWNFTATISDIIPTVSVSSHAVDEVYQIQCMFDITATMCMTSCALQVTSHPQFRTSHHFMYDKRYTLSDLNSTVSLSSHPPYRWYHNQYMYDLTFSYLWHHIHYIYDIISTKYNITTLCVDDATLGLCKTFFALQMTTHTLYHTKPQYLWYHIHLRLDNTAPI